MKLLYVNAGYSYQVDGKTVNRVLDNLAANEKISIYIVPEALSTPFVKCGTKLLVVKKENEINLEEACLKYNELKLMEDCKKKSAKNKQVLELQEQQRSKTISDNDGLNNSNNSRANMERHIGHRAGTTDYSKSRKSTSTTNKVNMVSNNCDKIDKTIEKCQDIGLFNFILGLQRPGIVVSSRSLHKLLCKSLEAKNRNDTSAAKPKARDFGFYCNDIVRCMNFRLLVRNYWIPDFLLRRICKLPCKWIKFQLNVCNLDHSKYY